MNIDWIEDVFGPVSQPQEEYCCLPSDTNVTFIGSEEELKSAEILLESTCLGVDWEWRPSLVKYNITTVALLQIGDLKNIFLIDMKALSNSEALVELLTSIFGSESINIIGMSFHNDLSALAAVSPSLNFRKKIANLYDIQPMYSSIYKKPQGIGLTKIWDDILGKKVCKFEQMANWERRPLRKSQMHYAALDAFILVEIFNKMKTFAEEKNFDVTKFWNMNESNQTGSMNPNNMGVSSKSKCFLKAIKLKSGQKVAPNNLLADINITGNEEYNFWIDYSLSKLHKLFKHFGLNWTKVTKGLNIIDRGNMLN